MDDKVLRADIKRTREQMEAAYQALEEKYPDVEFGIIPTVTDISTASRRRYRTSLRIRGIVE